MARKTPALALLLVLTAQTGLAQAAGERPGLAAEHVEEAIALGHLAVAQREGLVGTVLPETSAPLLTQQHRNLDAARGLLALNDAEHHSDLHRAVALAKRGTRWQTETLGLGWQEPVPLRGFERPSEALLELARRHGAEPTTVILDGMRDLDQLPGPLASSLARFVDAFLAFETASHLAYTDGIDLSPLFPARNQFLEAILDLDQALEETSIGISTTAECMPLQLPPVFSIDLTDCDNLYTEDFVLLLDVAGNDVYENNAGGNNIDGHGPCGGLLGLLGEVRAAALVDLGTGDDRYGDPEQPRSCGANGGGFRGAGFLLDAGGNDTYRSRSEGTNGGGHRQGVGFLLDAGGDDTYTAGNSGTNGGGANFGVGLLLDAGGDDTYRAGIGGTNGGGDAGIGFLLDTDGNDTYIASDTYIAGVFGTNGGGHAGIGFLLDAGGDDTYIAGDYGTNGGGYFAGAGFLLDTDGDDTYIAGDYGTNGGGLLGTGFLLDASGTDYYEDPLVPTGSCRDCTIAPKGHSGAQMDVDG